jgi:DNA-directed RNA polymerase specialized sigma24 family protein
MAIEFADSDKWLHHFSHQVARRMRAYGVRVFDVQDVYQECTIAWCVARNAFDESRGVPFTPYMINGVRMHINAWLRKEMGDKCIAITSSLQDATFEKGTLGDIIGDDTESAEDALINGEQQLAFVDLVSDGAESAEDTILKRQERARNLRRLSKEARTFLTLLENPPDELVEEFKRIRERTAYGRAMGFPSASPKRISSSLVFELMGATHAQRAGVYREIEGLLK